MDPKARIRIRSNEHDVTMLEIWDSQTDYLYAVASAEILPQPLRALVETSKEVLFELTPIAMKSNNLIALLNKKKELILDGKPL